MGEGRPVPIPPELTALLWRHINTFGYGPDGRLFCGEKGGEIAMITYTRVWRAARRTALTEEAQASPSAVRPSARFGEHVASRGGGPRDGCRVGGTLAVGADGGLRLACTGRSLWRASTYRPPSGI
ncbi:hypothetical protein Atai01_18470 [Amycolatopsis taiwanensis]|uniref:Uncharacterized protein n=1 Tax=Amycolatopsis taiwanensis TaxID=342230 RepID=A0A9W6VBQ1_9PSEU|nr:hypothetical protein Atai01_18470 [Amycolatopsis taiwanensis]